MHSQRRRSTIGAAALLILGILFATVAPAASQAGITLRIDEIATDEFPTVRVQVTVRDVNGVPVTGLGAGNFKIVEDDNAEAIAPAEVIPQVNPELEIAVLMAIDVSGSMKGQPLASAKAAANSFLDSLGPGDRAAVIAFSDEINLNQPFPQIDENKEHDYTQDRNALKNVINFLEAGGNTPLYDAAFKAVKMTARESRGNRAVILLTDGRDEVLRGPIGSGSKIATADDPIEEANRANIPVFTVGLGNEIDREYLQRVALRTGGVYQETPDPDQLTELFQNVLTQLKQQYVLFYGSTVPDLNTPHRVIIRVTTGGEQATDGATLGAALPPAQPTETTEAMARETTAAAEEVVEEVEEGLLTRIRDYVEDNTRNVALGAGAVLAVVLLLLFAALRRRRSEGQRCPTCGREIPVGGTCPYCEGWTGDLEVETPAAQAGAIPAQTPPEPRPDIPPTVLDVEPTVHVEEPPPSVDKTRVIERPPRHVGLFMVQQGPHPGARFEVAQEVISLGRRSENDIHLDHPTVSREHARVRLEGDEFVIYDLGSANGTKVNGVLVEEPQPLKDGDEVQLGDIVLVFKVIS